MYFVWNYSSFGHLVQISCVLVYVDGLTDPVAITTVTADDKITLAMMQLSPWVRVKVR